MGRVPRAKTGNRNVWMVSRSRTPVRHRVADRAPSVLTKVLNCARWSAKLQVAEGARSTTTLQIDHQRHRTVRHGFDPPPVPHTPTTRTAQPHCTDNCRHGSKCRERLRDACPRGVEQVRRLDAGELDNQNLQVTFAAPTGTAIACAGK
jgi:hypothetical protein